mmetsp:Transcript_18232/g.47013  ORF Transcript_18232/g.47013 Transcript_18232/m.47013 type:complete len:230 (+) Transcript_18232:44-733(+)
MHHLTSLVMLGGSFGAPLERRAILRAAPLVYAPLLPTGTALACTPHRARLGSPQKLSLASAARLILADAAPMVSACRAAQGVLLLRGEARSGCWVVPCPEADLLSDDTYSSAHAAGEFSRAANALARVGSAATPANGHLAIADAKIAGRWGNPCSIWPLGELHYCYLRTQREWWPGIDGFVSLDQLGLEVDSSLADALSMGHEVLFTSSRGYVSVASEHEAVLRRLLGL